MSHQGESQFGTLLAAFLAGAALGAVIVALTTPKTGEKLREDLGDLLDRLKGEDLSALLDRLKGSEGPDPSQVQGMG